MTKPRKPRPLSETYVSDPRYAYLEWLHMEARILRIELDPQLDPDLEFSPCGTFARGFHFPRDKSWQDAPQPSTRALKVLEAAGVKIPARVRKAVAA